MSGRTSQARGGQTDGWNGRADDVDGRRQSQTDQVWRQASKQASDGIRRSGIMMIGSGSGPGYRKMSLFVRQAAAIEVFSFLAAFFRFPR